MIASLGLILLCQPGGEVFARGLGVPVPGPVIGLILLLGLLLARGRFAALARGPLLPRASPWASARRCVPIPH